MSDAKIKNKPSATKVISVYDLLRALEQKHVKLIAAHEDLVRDYKELRFRMDGLEK